MDQQILETLSDVLALLVVLAIPADFYLGVRWVRSHYATGIPFFSWSRIFPVLGECPSTDLVRAQAKRSWLRPLAAHQFDNSKVGFRESFFFSSGWRGFISWDEPTGLVSVVAYLNFFPILFAALVAVRGLLAREFVVLACVLGLGFLYLIWQQYKLKRFVRRIEALASVPSSTLVVTQFSPADGSSGVYGDH